MADIHIDPVALREDVDTYEEATLVMFDEQLANYNLAHVAISGPRADWFGGKGGTGRIQDASRELLASLAGELEMLIAEKKRINDTFRQHLSQLGQLANFVQSADEATRDAFDKIAKDLGGGR